MKSSTFDWTQNYMDAHRIHWREMSPEPQIIVETVFPVLSSLLEIKGKIVKIQQIFISKI